MATLLGLFVAYKLLGFIVGVLVLVGIIALIGRMFRSRP